MPLLLFIVVVIILLALWVGAMSYLPMIGEPFKAILIVLGFIIAIAAIAERTGVFGAL